MASRPTGGFRAEAVRVALTSGLPRKQVAADFGVEVSTLSRLIHQDRRNPEQPVVQSDLEREIAELRKENRMLREEREVLKNRSGLGPACARYKQLVLPLLRRAVADGLLVVLSPLKNVAHWLMRT